MNNLKSILLILGGAIVAGLMGFAASYLASSHNSPAPLPAPAITGSYSTTGLSGRAGCRHSGAGWITVPAESGGAYYVKDVYYCLDVTGGAVTPVKGDPYNLYGSFSFSKVKP